MASCVPGGCRSSAPSAHVTSPFALVTALASQPRPGERAGRHPAFVVCGACGGMLDGKATHHFGWLALGLAAAAMPARSPRTKRPTCGPRLFLRDIPRPSHARRSDPAAAVSESLYNLVWYGARVLWFAAPWSLLALLAWRGGGGVAALTAGPAGSSSRCRYRGVPRVFSLATAGRSATSSVYFIVATAARRGHATWPRIERALRPLDAALAPAVVFALTFALHLLGGALELPRIKVWARTSDGDGAQSSRREAASRGRCR